MIPGLENAEFARLGGLHRNTYPQFGPLLLDPTVLQPEVANRGLRFAGQITGCEGYVESAAVGLMAGRFRRRRASGPAAFPSRRRSTTAFGALINHITGGHIVSEDEPGKRSFQPMNINFGLFPPVAPPDGKRKLRGRERKQAYCRRALEDLGPWLSGD